MKALSCLINGMINKIACICCIVALTSTSAFAATGVCGDCNQDGVVNIVDSEFAAQIGAGLLPLPAPDVVFDCDVNSDGSINFIDSLKLARESAGLQETLSCQAPIVATCGDCNQDGFITILDALRAAQHAAGLISIPDPDFKFCNPFGIGGDSTNPGAVVDIVDGLVIAQTAVGLVPYQDLDCEGDNPIDPPTPTPILGCGDCFRDGVFNILDALHAARIAAGLVNPNDYEKIYCNVDNDSGIDILDALKIAQSVAGLFPPDVLECPITQCSDGLDNDGDGLTDLDDPCCEGDLQGTSEDCPVVCTPEDADCMGRCPTDPDFGKGCGRLPECSDGEDNDGDGFTDYPSDPCCESELDQLERCPNEPIKNKDFAWNSYNLMVGQQPIVEVEPKSGPMYVRLKIHDLFGTILVDITRFISAKHDFDVKSLINIACASSTCQLFDDALFGQIFGPYGILKVEVGKTLDANGDIIFDGTAFAGGVSTYTFRGNLQTADHRPFRPVLKGSLYADSNAVTVDVDGGDAVWLETYNPNPVPMTFQVVRKDISGNIVDTKVFTLNPFGRFDVQAGHEDGNSFPVFSSTVRPIAGNKNLEWFGYANRVTYEKVVNGTELTAISSTPYDRGIGTERYEAIAFNGAAPVSSQSCTSFESWLQISNVSSNQNVNVNVQLIDSNGVLVYNDTMSYAPGARFDWTALPLKTATGYFTYKADVPEAIRASISTYGNNACGGRKSGRILDTIASYVPVLTSGNEISAPLNTFLNQENPYFLLPKEISAGSTDNEFVIAGTSLGRIPAQIVGQEISSLNFESTFGPQTSQIGTVTTRMTGTNPAVVSHGVTGYAVRLGKTSVGLSSDVISHVMFFQAE